LCILWDNELPTEFKEHSVDWTREMLAREAGRYAQDVSRRPNIEVFEGDPVEDSCVLQIRPAQICLSRAYTESPAL
jgi:hypothetical protein